MDTQRINRRDDCIAALFCLICAAALLMVCSMNSWLYPANPWVDVNIIATVGRGMFDGLVPYRDLFDHKGPLAFLIFGLGTELFSGRYYALYLFEVISVAGAMYFGWKTAKLYRPGLSVAWMAPLCAVLLSSEIFGSGGTCEELLLMPMAWSLYDLLRVWHQKEPMRKATLLRNGFWAGCVLWVKFNLVAFYLVWMAAVALEVLVRERRLKSAIWMCLIFAGGVLLATVPWLIYFGANGALDDLFQGYFLQNATQYSAGMNVLKSIALALYLQLRCGRWHALLLAVAGLTVLLLPRRRMPVREKMLLVLLASAMVVAMFCRMGILYYGVALAVFLPFALIPADALFQRIRRIQVRWLVAVSAVAACVALVCGDLSVRHLGASREDLPQTQVARILQESGDDPTLLCYGGMDAGFYMAADIQPMVRRFTQNNMDSQNAWMEEQSRMVDAEIPDYIVTDAAMESRLEGLEQYERIGTFETNYGRDVPQDQVVYCLYRRGDEGEDMG